MAHPALCRGDLRQRLQRASRVTRRVLENVDTGPPDLVLRAQVDRQRQELRGGESAG